MDLNLRQEKQEDYLAVFDLIKSAFEHEVYSDKKEHILVQNLRNSKSFIPELSIVALIGDEIVGHILLSKIEIIDNEISHSSLALAPVSVLPNYQKMGIGSKLINLAHLEATRLGYTSVILVGHKNYYPRFGYKQLHQFEIKLPFDVKRENCMAIELLPDALRDVSGLVKYPAEFLQ